MTLVPHCIYEASVPTLLQNFMHFGHSCGKIWAEVAVVEVADPNVEATVPRFNSCTSAHVLPDKHKTNLYAYKVQTIPTTSIDRAAYSYIATQRPENPLKWQTDTDKVMLCYVEPQKCQKNG
ncbi:hypothetical protein SCHPADRAFT_896929 [Schizopora paradoxa]|uniref:Uncharacterized protein n=1 Tax=Schizopora paradoxa TaxID=27342 RepID=A0A0H2QZZ0_9AGAM|nr:hypothetical protein SCHPADRAFT_896929 [Schizopora paradoxa]